MARYLFLSFQGCIKGLAHGKISDEDLRTALFAFDCPEDWAYCTPMQTLKYYTGIEDETRLHGLHFQIIKHLKKAECEHRAGYEGDGSRDNWFQMRAFLARNGFRGLQLPEQVDPLKSHQLIRLMDVIPSLFDGELIPVGKNWEGVEPVN